MQQQVWNWLLRTLPHLLTNAEGVHFETEKIWHQLYSNGLRGRPRRLREDTEC